MLSLPHRHRLKIVAFVIGASLMMGCGFDAVLKSTGPATVRLVFTDTLLTAGDIVPLVVTVIAGGVPQAHPNLIAFTDNPTVVGVNAGDDSLIAYRAGVVSIHLRFQSSLRPIPADTVIAMRVRP
jgi:hypothetical protein